jgi:hypothetical protein
MSNNFRPSQILRLFTGVLLSFCIAVGLGACRSGDSNPSIKPGKAELLSGRIERLYDTAYGLVRIDRLNVEGSAVVAAARGHGSADAVSQQASDLGARYAATYISQLQTIKKSPRAKVEAAVDAVHAADPSNPRQRLVYTVLKRHLNSVYAGLELAASDIAQDYASARYMP